ncbi:hypothetical protein NDU88_007549 [Pleurodeles waltl]|uniref:Uncharacterized protein n=1 Tax=Pleurodeles waltl TaxID=8319 RepID=A0AAV7VTV0_PLEWA|nr:hypothetical protein NDU88_007549 [Pleurodeles waltl]
MHQLRRLPVAPIRPCIRTSLLSRLASSRPPHCEPPGPLTPSVQHPRNVPAVRCSANSAIPPPKSVTEAQHKI